MPNLKQYAYFTLVFNFSPNMLHCTMSQGLFVSIFIRKPDLGHIKFLVKLLYDIGAGQDVWHAH